MLLGNNNKMDDRPVADDAQERLERVMEILCGTATNSHCSHKPEGYQSNSRNMNRSWPEVLSMQGERVVVWNIVLRLYIS